MSPKAKLKISRPKMGWIGVPRTLSIQLVNFGNDGKPSQIKIRLKIYSSSFDILLGDIKEDPENKGVWKVNSVLLNGSKVASKDASPSAAGPEYFLRLEVLNKPTSSMLKYPHITIPYDCDKKERIKVQVLDSEDVEWMGDKREFELPGRIMSLQDKFLNFLKWQKPLIYGPPGHTYFLDGVYSTESHWDQHQETKRDYRKLNISATGKHSDCYVCSPFAAIFLAFWLNYHGAFNNTFGSDLDSIAKGYSAFLIQKKWRDGDICRQWRFQNWIERESFKPGTIFVCGGKGHVWLVVKFGPGFTFPKEYIFGSGEGDPARGHEPCPEGWYKVHASAPPVEGAPIDLLFQGANNCHKRKDIERAIRILRKDPNKEAFSQTLPEKVETYEDIARNLENELNGNTLDNVRIFRGTPLFWMNGAIFMGSDNMPKIAYALNTDGSLISYFHKTYPFRVYRVLDVLDENTGMVSKDKIELQNISEDIKKRQLRFAGNDSRPIVFNYRD